MKGELATRQKVNSMEWVDVHAHLNMLEIDPAQTIKNAAEQGVVRMISIATQPSEFDTLIELTDRFYPTVSCTMGVHPHEAKLFSQSIFNDILERTKNPKVVAIGEIGLDFYYLHSEKKEQHSAFQLQLEIAQQVGLPIEIHAREAEKEIVDEVTRFPNVKGLVHCFTGSAWFAEEMLARGYDLSFSGVITFKNAQNLRQVVGKVPLNRMHIETDAPFLAPIPHRGKKNEPAYIVETARWVSELKGIGLTELSQQLKANALGLFSRLSWDG